MSPFAFLFLLPVTAFAFDNTDLRRFFDDYVSFHDLLQPAAVVIRGDGGSSEVEGSAAFIHQMMHENASLSLLWYEEDEEEQGRWTTPFQQKMNNKKIQFCTCLERSLT